MRVLLEPTDQFQLPSVSAALSAEGRLHMDLRWNECRFTIPGQGPCTLDLDEATGRPCCDTDWVVFTAIHDAKTPQALVRAMQQWLRRDSRLDTTCPPLYGSRTLGEVFVRHPQFVQLSSPSLVKALRKADPGQVAALPHPEVQGANLWQWACETHRLPLVGWLAPAITPALDPHHALWWTWAESPHKWTAQLVQDGLLEKSWSSHMKGSDQTLALALAPFWTEAKNHWALNPGTTAEKSARMIRDGAVEVVPLSPLEYLVLHGAHRGDAADIQQDLAFAQAWLEAGGRHPYDSPLATKMDLPLRLRQAQRNELAGALDLAALPAAPPPPKPRL